MCKRLVFELQSSSLMVQSMDSVLIACDQIPVLLFII